MQALEEVIILLTNLKRVKYFGEFLLLFRLLYDIQLFFPFKYNLYIFYIYTKLQTWVESEYVFPTCLLLKPVSSFMLTVGVTGTLDDIMICCCSFISVPIVHIQNLHCWLLTRKNVSGQIGKIFM